MKRTAWIVKQFTVLAVLGSLACGAWAQGKPIVIGQSIVLAGPGALRGQPFHEGAKLYFDRVNAAGGVNGRKIELVTLDDHGSPALTVENTKKLLAQQPLALFGYYGSPQVTAVYPMIKDSDVLLFAPMAAADEFRGANYPNVYSIRPGYAEEAAAIARHADTLGAAKKLGILHANDGESVAALDSALRTMTSTGANVVANAAFQSGAVAGPVDKVLGAGPQSVLVIGDANGAAGAIRDLRAKGFRGPIYGFSNTGESLLAEELGREGAGVVVVRVVPKSDTAKVPVVRELMQDASAAKMVKTNVYMLEGYIAARAFTEALKRSGKDVSRAKFKKALGSMEDVSLGGFRVHFADDRTGSKLVELSLIDSQGKVRE